MMEYALTTKICKTKGTNKMVVFIQKPACCLTHVLVILCVICSIIVTANSNALDCNFNRNACSWRNVYRRAGLDNFNWKLGWKAKGMQRGSGTDDDHGGGGGYMFIKSKTGRGNRTAKLLSPYFTTNSQTCFNFWYFMKGRSMGHLAVFLANTSNIKKNPVMLWNLRGNQGNAWRNARIPLGQVNNQLLVIEAFDLHKGKSGNILLDDTSLTNVSNSNPCSRGHTPAMPRMSCGVIKRQKFETGISKPEFMSLLDKNKK